LQEATASEILNPREIKALKPSDVNKFSKTIAKLASSSALSLANQKTTGQK
jgi:hypothetical protein